MSALSGVRVLDFTEGVGGPVAGMWCADFGADVVKVEPPDGDWGRRRYASAVVWNRGKRSITADFRSDHDRERVHRFAANADLVLGTTNTLLAFGILDSQFHESHPDLVIVCLDPFEGTAPWYGGQEDPALLAATTGLALHQSSYGGEPVDLVWPMTSYAQGVWGATCAVAALIEREYSGLGQVVTVNGLHGFAIVATQAIPLDPRSTFQPRAYGPPGPNPTYTYYLAGDGREVFIATFTPKFQQRLLEVLGLPNVIDDPRLSGSFASMLAPGNRGWVRETIAEAFAGAPADVWLARLRSAGVPCGPVSSLDDWFDSDQVAAIQMHHRSEDPRLGTVDMVGIPVVLVQSPGTPGRPSTVAGEDDELAEPWPVRHQRSATNAPLRHGPLDGLKVLSFGTFVAGPFSAMLLGELGAEVVKVETLEGDPFRGPAFDQNRGMRSVALDLRTPAGRDVLGKLAGKSDVVLENFRPGVAQQLGVDYDSLSIHNPALIGLSLTGFGEVGPLANDPAFDGLLQAVGGMMRTQGGQDEPVMMTVAYNDVMAAALSTLAVTLALFHRERTGIGQRIWTSIAGTTLFLQSNNAVRYAGASAMAIGGRDYKGPSEADRFYAVADGWVRLHAETLDRTSLSDAGLLSDVHTTDDDVAQHLAESLSRLNRADAARRLTTAGIAAVSVRTFNELALDEQLVSAEILHAHKRPSADIKFFTAGRYARLSRTQRTDIPLAPGVGEHSAEVLTELGYSAAEVAALADQGAIRLGEAVDWEVAPAYR